MTRSRHAKNLGDLGEEKAAAYLQEHGFQILQRNFRAGHGEIDIIALDGPCLCFVEVKTCQSDRFGEPETWVTVRKQRRMISAAAQYRVQHQLVDVDSRYDIITLRLVNGALLINHIRDAFWVNEDNESL
jgi:putative endonuclease